MSIYFQSLLSYKSTIEDNSRFLIDSISCNNEISFNDCLMSACCICGTWGGRNPLFKFAHQLFSSSSGVKGTISLSISALSAFKKKSLDEAIFTKFTTFSDKQEHILFNDQLQDKSGPKPRPAVRHFRP